ncbi:MAG: hypothetical protein MI923_02290 [Phycisphaerales bacterium]|nr:hypothetical protein [Phycisphaerales bacterium]
MNLRRLMMTKRQVVIVVMATFWPVMLAASVRAQDSEKTDGATPKSAGSSLADREAIVRDRVSRLEDRMFQLSQALRKAEPDKAGRLLEGLGDLRSRLVREQLDEIIQKLEGEQFSDAVDLQQAVVMDLQELLKLLLEDPEQLEERKEELERLEAIRRELEKIIKEQEEEKADAEEARRAEQRAEALEAAAKQLKNLIERQKEVAGKTSQKDAPLDEVAKAQSGIRRETEALAKAMESIADAESRAGDEEAADGEPKSSQGGEAGQAAKELNNAAEKMDSAEKSLGEGQAGDAKKSQDEAAKDLEQALEKIEEQARQLRNKLSLKKQSETQRETAEKSKQLLDEMKGDSQAEGGGTQGGGEQQQGQPSGDQSGSQEGDSQEGALQEQVPGKEGVEQAVPLQEGAADDLEKEKLEEAIEKQEEAIEKLKSAKEALEDRLDQLRKEQQEELLAALESRFRAMLSRQIECNKSTNRLADLGPDNWKRSDQLELAELSQRQRWVGDQADESLFLLVEEGSTVVLPQLVEHVRDDARDVADRLAAADAGETVRLMQSDLEQVLRDIIDAIKRKQEELESGGGGQGGGGNTPLLPGSAELKLLRACQLRVNVSTEKLHDARTKTEARTEDIDSGLKRLSKRQADVAEMAKEMHEALSQAQ